MPASWRRGWGFLIWCCGIRRTAALRSGQTLYTQEGRAYYDGDLHVPNDLDTLTLAGE